MARGVRFENGTTVVFDTQAEAEAFLESLSNARDISD